jgi:hypothetical protein
MSESHKLLETITALAYRWAAYASHNLIDDAAMLAFIFS